MRRLERGDVIGLTSLLALVAATGQRLVVTRELRAADMRRKFAHIHAERD